MEWTKEQYNRQYERWVPWLEDMFLRFFTRDNKASYATKQNLDKTKVTGIDQVDHIQDGLHSGVSSQLGQDGLGRPIGDLASKEGLNRFERKGKDDKGRYVSDPSGGHVTKGGSAVAGSAQQGLGAVGDTVSGVGNTVGGVLGGGKQK